MSKELAACGAILALAVLAILYFMPIPQPYTNALALSQGLRELGVNWWGNVSQAYDKDFLADLRLGTTLWSYRAIDIIIQAFLILGAACGVTALFRIEPPKEVIEEEEAVIEAPIEELIEEEEV
ncbi:MAG: hypothetical protein QXD66_05035 [Candidatus Nezhaarchaeales archaeon]|nr:MAG: hypothetical protein DSO06_02985 [Candidatus Nezhaarchaeota archaeon WYZ-LMO8]TDA37276.1 MAG: hypothetical protein DSO05_00795 [Candidatus Nezhaarchaeota archaeon WYZ-LMO7]